MKSILMLLLGAIIGSVLMLGMVLVQWHFPEKIGGTIPWLPIQQHLEIKSAGSIRAMPPVAAHVSDYEPGSNDIIVAEPTPMVWPPPGMETPVTETPAVQATSMLIPVDGVKQNQLLDTFNDARGGGRIHDAIDIMAPKGTSVFAVNDGKVAKLFNSKQGGLTVYQFDTGEIHAYYYAHLDSYAIGLVEGSLLKRGDLIGYVGSTGNASPEAPHLHFAIFVLGPEKKWWQGTAINPYPMLHGTK